MIATLYDVYQHLITILKPIETDGNVSINNPLVEDEKEIVSQNDKAKMILLKSKNIFFFI